VELALAPRGGTAVASPIHQEIVFKTTPEHLYEVLMDAKQHSALSGGAPAEISRDVGGSWSAFGGEISGRNVELMPNRRIVQAWRSKNWAEGVYSIVRFEIKREGSETRLVLDHTGFPDGEREHLNGGWQKMYWEPLKRQLE
jgi:activator of HSP90 ATPase